MTSSIYNSTSPYFETKQRNILIEFLDLMENRSVPADLSDQPLIVKAKYHQRPDLLSNDLYGTPDLWWVFIVRNPNSMVDPIYDLVTDMEIFVPTQSRMFALLGS